MKNYSHIASELFYRPTLLTPLRHGAICQLLESRLAMPERIDNSPGGDAQIDSDEDENEMQEIADTVIIPVHGTLVAHPEDIAMSECGCSMEDLGKMIDLAEHNPRIRTMIFDFRTPGGSVTGIPEMGRKILGSRKETIAFTDSECCSGGIWLASQCQRFYGTESSRIGSVGVYTLCLDMSKALKKDGVKINAISAGKYKLLGAYWKELGDDERKIMQGNVDKIYEQFKDAMESHRMVSDEHFGNGLVFDGQEAAEIGFTDGVVDSLEEVLDELS